MNKKENYRPGPSTSSGGKVFLVIVGTGIIVELDEACSMTTPETTLMEVVDEVDEFGLLEINLFKDEKDNHSHDGPVDD